MGYVETGKATLRERVLAMGYKEIAALCGVTLGPNGESPPDFFYKNVRAALAEELVEPPPVIPQSGEQHSILLSKMCAAFVLDDPALGKAILDSLRDKWGEERADELLDDIMAEIEDRLEL